MDTTNIVNQTLSPDDQIIQYLYTLQDHHDVDNRQWINNLITERRSNTTSECTELGILANITILDTVIAKLLNIEPQIIAKIAMLTEYIKQIWEANNLDIKTLDNPIVQNEQQREHILDLALPNRKTRQETCNLEHDKVETLTLTQFSTSEMDTDTEIEDETEESKTSTIPFKESKNIFGKDIKMIDHYEIRNRDYHPLNPYHITESGKFKAGVLTTNTPGNNKMEQINYLANSLNLPKEKTNLINTIFHNGNNWYSINFNFAFDLENCINKFNNKHKEDFKLIVIENQENNKKEEHGKKTKTKPSKPTQPSYNLSTPIKKDIPSNYQLRIQCSTIPGEGRESKISTITDLLQIPLDSPSYDIISIGHNKWINLIFENPYDLELAEHNIKNKHPTINSIRFQQKTNTHPQDLEENTNPTATPSNQKNQNLPNFNNNNTTQTIILDIPTDFSIPRIKGALKIYGHISNLQITEGNNNFKSATVTFNSLQLNLNETWAIPMGTGMARILPLQNHKEILSDRNRYTTRLYGINKETSATRIMSATKHLQAKTVYIPRNSKTNKKRNFAIIGFKNQENLQTALSAHVELFGHKTWWSTKDNLQLLDKKKQGEKKQNKKDKGKAKEEFTELDPSHSENIFNINIAPTSSPETPPYPSSSNKKDSKMTKKYYTQKHKDRYTKNPRKTHINTSPTETTLSSITSVLHNIAKRLDKLEKKENRSRALNHS
jgi:hypothetical protein